MDIENLIKDTFTAHEHVAPDGDEVLAAARRRIDRGRTVLGTPLAVAAGVVALTLVAVTVIALNRPGSSDSAPVAAPSGAAEQVVDDLAMPFSLDWLPPGAVEYLVRRINFGGTVEEPDVPVYGGEYMLTVTTDDGQVLQIGVQENRGAPVNRAAINSGPGRPVTIDGRHGFESSRSDRPGGYELYVAHPEGGSMYVHVSTAYGSTVPPQQLTDTGRRIAENVSFPGTATVTPAFGLRDLPDGLRICTFDVEKPFEPSPIGSRPSTGYSLGTCTTIPSIHVHNTAADKATGTPGRPVQGRETRHSSEGDGVHRLSVLDAVDGAAVAVEGDVPLAELYEIADRLVLPESGS